MNFTHCPPPPETILFNGFIVTQNKQYPYAEGIAIGQGQITVVGKNSDVLHLSGPGTEAIDLGGRLVLPGFIDTHIHFHEWALKRNDLQLDSVTSLDELLVSVHKKAESLQPGHWVLGQGWNESDWPEERMPTCELLDRVAPAHPVLLWRCDLHLAAANTAALQLAGIDAASPDPPEGIIERDMQGNPTGILRELAINLVRRVVKQPEPEQIVDAYQTATEALHRLGITGIHDIRLMDDNDGGSALQAFQKLDQQKMLDLRCWVSLPGHRVDELIDLGLRSGFGNDRLRFGHVKFFSDGGVGARTAWMVEPYLDAACGMPLMDMDVMAREIRKADSAGLSVMVHAIGDRANREVITIFEDLEDQPHRAGTFPPQFPHRIEHLQVIRPEDIERLKRLPLALGVTPTNLMLDINLIDTALGDKGRWAYSFRQLLDTGLPVMFSSDCPVCDPNPLLAVHAAVTRQRKDGTPQTGWYPDARISVTEAIQAYTATPAAVHNATELGTIAPQKRADLAVFSENYVSGSPIKILQSQVDMTLFNGRIVHRRF